MKVGSGLRVAAGVIGLAVLAGCHRASHDIMVDECVHDGEPLRYCECVARGMKHSLSPTDYQIFTRFVTLGGIDSAGPDDILNLMEAFKLSPADLAAIRGNIATLTEQVHAQCAAQE